MNFAFTDEQREIQMTAKRLMAETSGFDRMVELSESEAGFDPVDYRQIAELGWTGMHIPEQFGGVGLSYVELVVVLEQMGTALYSSPFFASVCLAANALLEAGVGEHGELLSAIASGERTATIAITEPGGGWTSGDVRLTAVPDGDDWVLDGVKTYVIDGNTADTVIVVARSEGDGDSGITLLAVDGAIAGLTRVPVHSVDGTRRFGQLTFDGARVPAIAVIGEPGKAWPVVSRTLALASVALAAESLGAASRCFDVALTYTKDRYQFGRPIAAFQAIKHICADLLMAVEQSRSAAYYAGWAAAANREELPVVAPLAKAQVCDAFWQVAKANIQLHGGIGFTYEHEAHYYYRRATASRALLGDSDFQRENILLGLGA